MSKKLSASSSPWVPLNKGHEFLGANKMDCDLVEKIKMGGISPWQAKQTQEWRNLRASGQYQPCIINGIEKTPTEISLENTRRNNNKLKELLRDAVSMQAMWKDKYEKLAGIEGEKEYWKKLCGLQMIGKVKFLLNKLEEEIYTLCSERDKNSTDWCPYGCYHYNTFVTNYKKLIKDAFVNQLDEISVS